MSYKYVSPENNGFKKVKLTKKEIKDLKRMNPINFSKYNKFTKYNFYENEKWYYVEIFDSWIFKVASIILYPIVLLFGGLIHFKELNSEIYRTLFPKKTGSFYTEHIHKDRLKQQKINETVAKIK